MKIISISYLFGVLFSFSLLSTSAQAQNAYTLFNKNGEEVSFEKMMEATEGKTVILFGEYHNNPISHWLQLEMTKALHVKNGANLVIGAEMFEADNQLLIDEYFADLIKQKSFEEEARLWKNYKTDYKPIVEYAKKHQLPFIATNVPRRYANMVFHNGVSSLEKLSKSAKQYIPKLPIKIDSTLSSYREICKMGSGHSGKFMMEAQAIKDATMAHFILANTSKQSVFFHLNGSYHSDNYQGINAFLYPKLKEEKILTISTVSQDNVEKLEQENIGLADYILCVNAAMTNTH